MYALISNTSNGLFGIFKSTTGGTAFTQVSGPTPNILAWNCDGGDSGGHEGERVEHLAEALGDSQSLQRVKAGINSI